MTPKRLILASTSPYRRTLLERLGLAFETFAPNVNEDALKPLFDGPLETAEGLAFEKARSVAEREPGAVVIGSDQVLAFRGRIFGKPGTVERALEQLRMLSGEAHELITALVVCSDEGVIRYADRTRLYMRALGPAEIARYVEADRPVDCAGSYKLEARGVALFDRIESADQTAITGLPLIALTTMLRSLGFQVP